MLMLWSFGSQARMTTGQAVASYSTDSCRSLCRGESAHGGVSAQLNTGHSPNGPTSDPQRGCSCLPHEQILLPRPPVTKDLV